jgi:hypothetical protein
MGKDLATLSIWHQWDPRQLPLFDGKEETSGPSGGWWIGKGE